MIFTLEGGASAQPQPEAHAPVEHISGQHAARLALQAAIHAEGKTEEQAFPPDQPVAAAADIRHARATRQGGRRGASRTRFPRRRTSAVWRANLGVDIYEVKGAGPGGRISEDDVKAHAKSLLAWRRGSRPRRRTSHFAAAELPDFTKWGKVERVSMRGVRRKTAEHLWEAWTTIPHVTQQDKPTSPNWSNCARASRPKRRKPAAR